MSQLNAINQELLRQINDSVGYKIKTKVDYLYNTADTNTSNINYITSNIPILLTNTAITINKLDSVLINTANALSDSANISLITLRTAALGKDDSANINYLTEATVINDTSLASTVAKSLNFHKFLTTEHIPLSNVYAPLASLEKSGDTYVTGLGACGVRKNGVDVFEEYYNGQYPGSMFGTFSCGKELMGMMLGRMQKKGIGLHNVAGDGYTSNLLTLDTKVYDIIYGTDIKPYGETGFTLPLGLENARMRDLLSQRAGFHDYDALLWFMNVENQLTGNYGYVVWSTATAPLLYSYRAWAVNFGVTIDTFDDVKNLGNQFVSVRNFAQYAYNDIIQLGQSSVFYLLKDFFAYAFYNEFTSNNVIGELMVGSGYSNTSVRYHRSAYGSPVYGQDKFEHYNNESFVFTTYMLQLALMKEAINGNRSVLTSSALYSNTNISLNDIGANTFGASVPNPVYVAPFRDNFRNFFNYEILQPSGVPSVNTKLTLLQSDKYGTIMPDYTRVAFPHLMGVADKFGEDLFYVRNNNVFVTNVYSNLFLSNITEYNFTASSSNIIPRMNALTTDPFETPVGLYGENLNAQNYLSMTNGIWTLTDVLPNNKQRSSNVYFLSGAQGQKFVMGRDSTASKNRYTVGMMSDDLVNNPLLCQGPEFLQTYKNTVEHYRTESLYYGKSPEDAVSFLVGKWYPDSISVPIFAYGPGLITGLRTRQEADKAIAYIQDIKLSSNNWGYDSVGGPTFRLNCDRSYYSNLTTDVNIIKVADITTGNVASSTSNCVADVHYSYLDIFNKAKQVF